MYTRILGFAGLLLSVSVAACSGASPESSDDSSSEDALSNASAATQLKGAWTLTSDNTSITSIVLESSHKFFRKNDARIMNGMVVNGGSFQREEGTWTVNASKHTITFHVNGMDDTMSYTYTPAPVMNGMFLPGHEPKAKLALQGIPAPHSHVAFPLNVYASADSFCFADADCSEELSSKIWTPADAKGTAVCKANACEMDAGLSQKHQPCGDDVAIQRHCAAGLTCVFPSSGPISEHTPGSCEEVSAAGGECGADVAIQKICAAGLTCVYPSTGPISEHTPGTCQ